MKTIRSRPTILLLGIKYYPSKGGTSRVVENLIHELKENFDFTIYCYRDKRSKAHIPGVKIIEVPEIKIKGIGVFVYYLICAFHLLLKHDYDLIHIHKTDAGFLYLLTKFFAPTIFTSHALPQLNKKWSFIGRFYFKTIERLVMRSSITKTCISSVQQEYFQSKYGAEVHFIPNGIYPAKGMDLNNDQFLIEYGIELPYVFFAARRIIPLKGVHTMIQSLDQIGFKGKVVLAGDYDQMKKYTHRLRVLASNLDVVFLGYITDMEIVNQLIKRSRLFIFPSEIEGMSMMLLEAGIIGTPMICSDIKPNKAVLSTDEALFFKSKSVKDLAEKLDWAFSHMTEMRKKALDAQKRIRKDYLMENVALKYQELYHRVLTNSNLSNERISK